MRFTRSLLLAAALGASLSAPVFAEEGEGSLDAAREAEVRTAMEAMGYEVRQVATEDGMIEVYAVKNGQTYEMYLNDDLTIARGGAPEDMAAAPAATESAASSDGSAASATTDSAATNQAAAPAATTLPTDPTAREAAIRAAVEAMGYEVRSVGEEDGQIEVYAIKDGKMAELYLNPDLTVAEVKSSD